MQNGLAHRISFFSLPRITLLFMVTVGFASVTACLYLSLFSGDLLIGTLASARTCSIGRIAFLTGFVLALIVASAASDSFAGVAGHRFQAIFVLAAALSLAFSGAIRAILPDSLPQALDVAVLVLEGGALACLAMLWSEYLSRFDRVFFSTCLSVGVILGALFYMVLCILPTMAIAVCSGVFLVASLLDVMVLRMFSKSVVVMSKEETLKSETRLYFKTDCFIALYGTVFGLGINMLGGYTNYSYVPAFIAVIIIIAGIVMLLTLWKNSGSMIHGTAQRVIFPLLVVALVPLPFAPDMARVACLLLIIACYVCFDITNIDSQLCIVSKVSSLPPYYICSRGRIPIVSGLLVSSVVYMIVQQYASDIGAAETYISLGLVVALALFIAFIPLEPDRLQMTESALKIIDKSEPGLPTRTEYCESIGRKFNLSAREIEVLELLSRGHGAKYIQDKLNISEGTVKTHSHQVYKKLKVSSREEILLLFEDNCQS